MAASSLSRRWFLPAGCCREEREKEHAQTGDVAVHVQSPSGKGRRAALINVDVYSPELKNRKQCAAITDHRIR